MKQGGYLDGVKEAVALDGRHISNNHNNGQHVFTFEASY